MKEKTVEIKRVGDLTVTLHHKSARRTFAILKTAALQMIKENPEAAKAVAEELIREEEKIRKGKFFAAVRKTKNGKQLRFIFQRKAAVKNPAAYITAAILRNLRQRRKKVKISRKNPLAPAIAFVYQLTFGGATEVKKTSCFLEVSFYPEDCRLEEFDLVALFSKASEVVLHLPAMLAAEGLLRSRRMLYQAVKEELIRPTKKGFYKIAALALALCGRDGEKIKVPVFEKGKDPLKDRPSGFVELSLEEKIKIAGKTLRLK